MRLTHLLRVIKLSVGGIWAIGLMWLGLWMWSWTHRMEGPWDAVAALVPFASGVFVWMMLVADELCPLASIEVTGLMKLTAAMVFWGASLITVAQWFG